jgi:hypothetical protein
MFHASIKRAAELNNHGIDLLIAGISQSAMNAFQCALSEIKDIVSDDPSDNEFSMSVSSVENVIRESPLRLHALQNDQSFIYDRPLVIQDIPSIIDDCDATLALLSSAILFNLALCCHQIARSGQEKALKRASVLYRMSLQLLQICDASDCTTIICLLACTRFGHSFQTHTSLKT